jgi:hypothetical protein
VHIAGVRDWPLECGQLTTGVGEHLLDQALEECRFRKSLGHRWVAKRSALTHVERYVMRFSMQHI